MKAIILVGGEGTRLRPLTWERPKPLLPIANVPFVERVLARLAAVGCDEVVLSTCYRSEAFEHLSEHAAVPVRVVVEETPLGTGGAIGYAASGADDTFLVLNGDILTDLDLHAVLAYHRDRGGEATIVLTPVDDPSRFGVVPARPDGSVEAFIEKPPKRSAPTNMINAGTYVCEPKMLERIAAGGPVSVERAVFPRMAEDGVLYAFPSDCYWLDFGTLETYLRGNVDCLTGLLAEPLPGKPEPHGDGELWVSPGAVVAKDAEVRGRVVVGAGAVVEAGAVVGPGVALGPAARIGAGAVVAESVLLDGASVGAGSTVRHTVVGFRGGVRPGVSFPAGSVVPPGTVV